MNKKKIKIEGTGVYFPKAITSEIIELKYGLPKGWSEKYSGVQNRHHVTHESIGFMGARAAEDALKASSVKLDDIDMLISAGGTYDYPLPNQSSLIKHHLTNGCDHDFPVIDIDCTCLSFVSGLDLASRMLDGETYKKILLVSSEIASKGLNPSNWETLTLFGDGAAAAVLSCEPTGTSSIIKAKHVNYSEGVFHSIIEGGGSVNYYDDKPFNKEFHSFKMDGKKLLRLAKTKLNLFVNSFFSNLDYTIEDIHIIIPHQASRIGMEMFNKMQPSIGAKVITTLAENGNCIAASIPMSLHYAIQHEKLKRGQTCFLIGTAAGFSIGALLFEY
ncbi:3-oxoacyl-[acyl-carrier-protein] synthase III C-terminal domain-containing protein [Aestuariivivens sediminis]|uniref:3-oxoacyl-[acyl-carrier-protein] synthase III C-terminal domain-containing protein n=1 Tax=Aestuariivivens sediminis TaxID=2913557 RepID=UPI001F56CAA2|nr:3-oxoacyl-[acyl-carrier-protein] synthase III C-terminal domain-containing protein [Aestuariivivens sediminis]